MTETEKKMIAERWGKAVMACGKAIKHSHNVIDFRIMNRKDFDSWKQSNQSSCVGGWPMVKKSHKFIRRRRENCHPAPLGAGEPFRVADDRRLT